MKLLGNLIWLIFGGIIISVEYLISSVLLMVTIVGIPFGLQTLKLSILALWPFGARIRMKESGSGCLSTLMNLIWIIIGGFWISLTHVYCLQLQLLVFHLPGNISKWQDWR